MSERTDHRSLTLAATLHPGRSKIRRIGPNGNESPHFYHAFLRFGGDRVLRHASNLTAGLIAGFRELPNWIQQAQRPDGLWSLFVDEPPLTPDTAGSAGLATALAIGAQQGWLPAGARTAAARCLAGLDTHLTADGFLGGVSQSNKGGEAIQRGSYRVIYQMAMGLMAQLIATLESPA